MILKDYIKNLNNLVDSNPECLNYQVISSEDDEGNGFNVVGVIPSIGHFDSECSEFYELTDIDPEEAEELDNNAVCIN